MSGTLVRMEFRGVVASRIVYLLPWHLQPGLNWHRAQMLFIELLQRKRKEVSLRMHITSCIRRLPKTKVTQILIRDGESFEGAIKRFTRKVQQDGVLSEAKRRRHYEPPSVKRKRKAETRARKARKAMAKAAARGF